MTVRYVQDDETIDYTPTTDTSAGTVVVQGNLVGVTKLDIRANKLGALAIEGLFDFPKATGDGQAIDAGARLYWDATNQIAVTSAGGGANKLIGKATGAAAATDPTVRIALGAGDAVTVSPAAAAAVADAAAVTATNAPAGGTGAAAGGWDTAAHRDAAITSIDALVTDVTALQAKLNALLASLRAAGLLAAQ